MSDEEFSWLDEDDELTEEIRDTTTFANNNHPKDETFPKLFKLVIGERYNEKVIFSHAKVHGSSQNRMVNVRLNDNLRNRINHMSECSMNTFFLVAAEYLLDNLEQQDVSLHVYDNE